MIAKDKLTFCLHANVVVGNNEKSLVNSDFNEIYISEWIKIPLLESHQVFSLEPNEMCTDVTEHMIKLLDDEPFKKKILRITPLLVDKVWQHVHKKC